MSVSTLAGRFVQQEHARRRAVAKKDGALYVTSDDGVRKVAVRDLTSEPTTDV